ncbi:hypothetical protein HDU93_007969 [Gonapodya sp. JEL0774]|nr:hypothetical protein HDU93_007969 [Gonapodya sp. JEL0774]
MQKYRIDKQLGDGSFGWVLRATNTETGETVAIKKMKKKFPTWDECVELREVKALKRLNDHPNVVKLKEVVRERDELHFVFEYCEGNLYQYMKAREGRDLGEERVRSIAYQICAGLAYMHRYGFFHRDMKPENLLLLGTHPLVKLADLGLAREIRSRPPYTEYVSTRWYRAPEVSLRSPAYSSPVDMWAVGCIVAELYALRPLFPGSSEMDQMARIAAWLGTPLEKTESERDKRIDPRVPSVPLGGGAWPSGHKLASAMGYRFPQYPPRALSEFLPPWTSPTGMHFVAMCLRWDPVERITAARAMQHPWFEGVSVAKDGIPKFASGGSKDVDMGTPATVSSLHVPIPSSLPPLPRPPLPVFSATVQSSTAPPLPVPVLSPSHPHLPTAAKAAMHTLTAEDKDGDWVDDDMIRDLEEELERETQAGSVRAPAMLSGSGQQQQQQQQRNMDAGGDVKPSVPAHAGKSHTFSSPFSLSFSHQAALQNPHTLAAPAPVPAPSTALSILSSTTADTLASSTISAPPTLGVPRQSKPKHHSLYAMRFFDSCTGGGDGDEAGDPVWDGASLVGEGVRQDQQQYEQDRRVSGDAYRAQHIQQDVSSRPLSVKNGVVNQHAPQHRTRFAALFGAWKGGGGGGGGGSGAIGGFIGSPHRQIEPESPLTHSPPPPTSFFTTMTHRKRWSFAGGGAKRVTPNDAGFAGDSSHGMVGVVGSVGRTRSDAGLESLIEELDQAVRDAPEYGEVAAPVPSANQSNFPAVGSLHRTPLFPPSPTLVPFPFANPPTTLPPPAAPSALPAVRNPPRLSPDLDVLRTSDNREPNWPAPLLPVGSPDDQYEPSHGNPRRSSQAPAHTVAASPNAHPPPHSSTTAGETTGWTHIGHRLPWDRDSRGSVGRRATVPVRSSLETSPSVGSSSWDVLGIAEVDFGKGGVRMGQAQAQGQDVGRPSWLGGAGGRAVGVGSGEGRGKSGRVW